MDPKAEKLEFNIQFVGVVQKFKVLYEPYVTDKSSKQAAWDQVSKTMKCSVNNCKKRWTSLRQAYVTNVCPHKKNAKPKKDYYLRNAMEFLKPYVKLRGARQRGKAVRVSTNDDNTLWSDDEDNSMPVLEKQSTSRDDVNNAVTVQKIERRESTVLSKTENEASHATSLPVAQNCNRRETLTECVVSPKVETCAPLLSDVKAALSARGISIAKALSIFPVLPDAGSKTKDSTVLSDVQDQRYSCKQEALLDMEYQPSVLSDEQIYDNWDELGFPSQVKVEREDDVHNDEVLTTIDLTQDEMNFVDNFSVSGNVEDGDLLFLRSLLQDLKKLDDRQKRMYKQRALQLFDELLGETEYLS